MEDVNYVKGHMPKWLAFVVEELEEEIPPWEKSNEEYKAIVKKGERRNQLLKELKREEN